MLATLFSSWKYLVVVAAVAFASGGALGYRYATGEVAKTEVKALVTEVAAANEIVADDKALAVKQAVRRSTVAAKAQVARSKGVNDAAIKASPSCDRDGVSFSLLIGAVDAANSADAAGRMPDKKPAATQAAGPLGQGDPRLGIRPD